MESLQIAALIPAKGSYGIDNKILQGRAEEAIAIAIEMKKDGMPISQIAKFTKLSEAEIEKL